MATSGRKNKTPKRTASPPKVSRASHVQKPETFHDRAMRRVSAEPSLTLIVGVIGFLIAVSIVGDRYAMNPNLLTGPWLYIVGALTAVFTFLAMSTLTSMAYCFMFHRDTAVVRAFVATLGNFATIGAILGTLLGLRLVTPFGIDLMRNRSSHEQPFMEYISLVGSAATMVTLMMIGFCWVRSLAAVISTIGHNIGAADSHSRWVVIIRVVLPAVIVLIANYAAVDAAFAMMFIVISK